jgi:hypothetical protein
MLSNALPFLSQSSRWSLTQRIESLGLCRGPRQEFPSPLALQRALRQALLARDPQQVAARIAEAAFECVVGPRQARHVIAVEQARPRASADRVEGQTTRLEGRRDPRQSHHRVERATPLSRHLLPPHCWGSRGV